MLLLVFCFILVFVFAFYAHEYFRISNNNLSSISNMSDDEFCDPAGARRRWSEEQTKQVPGSLFRWKRLPSSNKSDSPASKKVKKRELTTTVKTETLNEVCEVSEDKCGVKKTKQESMNKYIKLSDNKRNVTNSKQKPKIEFIDLLKDNNIVKPEKRENIQCIELSEDEENPTKLKQEPEVEFVESSEDENNIVKSEKEKHVKCAELSEDEEDNVEAKKYTSKINAQNDKSSIAQSFKKLVEDEYKNGKKLELPYASLISKIDIPEQKPIFIGGVSVLFPVTPYGSQISIMNQVIQGCKREKNCLLESPTGSGKTLALLCGTLAWQRWYLENQWIEEAKSAATSASASATTATAAAGKPDILDLITEFPQDTKVAKPKPRIFYGSRTHKQIEQVIREFRKTAYSNTPMTILSSREHTCLEEPKRISKTQHCNNVLDPQTSQTCKYYQRTRKDGNPDATFTETGLESPFDIEDLVQYGRQIRSCPYFGARNMMKDADIIFCPYNYIIDPVIRDSMQINLKNDVVIIDEAHNIENICRDVASAEFRDDNLSEAIDDCALVYKFTKKEIYQNIESYLNGLKIFIEEQNPPRETRNATEAVSAAAWNGEQTWEYLKLKRLGDERYQMFHMNCEEAIKAYKDVKENAIMVDNDDEDDDQKKGKRKKKRLAESTVNFLTVKLLESLILALKNIQDENYRNDYRVIVTNEYCTNIRKKVTEDKWISESEGQYMNSLKFLCMNSAVVFAQLGIKCRSIILASGTLSPTQTFESELGTIFGNKLHANHVVPKDQVYARVISCSSRGTDFKVVYANTQTLAFQDDLGQLLVDVCESVPHGVLCFFSSYKMMSTQIERWRQTEIFTKLERCKRVLEEPSYSNKLDSVMYEFRSEIRDTAIAPRGGVTGALLFAVFRGKIAEGIDFSDDEARCVVTVGIPYPVIFDPNVKLKMTYNDMNTRRGLLPGREWYSIQAYRALNQALGRCIRHKNDWGAVLLVDSRLTNPNAASNLPKWIREMIRSDHNQNLKEELKSFVVQQKKRDNDKISQV